MKFSRRVLVWAPGRVKIIFYTHAEDAYRRVVQLRTARRVGNGGTVKEIELVTPAWEPMQREPRLRFDKKRFTARSSGDTNRARGTERTVGWFTPVQ